MLNAFDVRQAILDHLKTSIPQKVYEQSIPDADTVRRDEKGLIHPYVAIQFGDPVETYGGGNLAGVRYSDYSQPIYAQVIAPEPQVAREIAMCKVLDALLGLKTPWTGQITKRPGGAMWPMTSSNGATEAYLFPVSFTVVVQMNDS